MPLKHRSKNVIKNINTSIIGI